MYAASDDNRRRRDLEIYCLRIRCAKHSVRPGDNRQIVLHNRCSVMPKAANDTDTKLPSYDLTLRYDDYDLEEAGLPKSGTNGTAPVLSKLDFLIVLPLIATSATIALGNASTVPVENTNRTLVSDL